MYFNCGGTHLKGLPPYRRMPPTSQYRGRFAPSPTGPLHFGSFVTAVGSYLEAKKHNGIWLVRMEDLDTPRTVPGAAHGILRTLEAFGLYWDETVLYQNQRAAAYQEALQKLQNSGMAYPCACSRKEIADSALHGIEGQIYPGTCRNGIPAGRQARAWRVRTDGHIPSPLGGDGQGERGSCGTLLPPPQPHPQGVRRWVPRRFAATLPQSPCKGDGVLEFHDPLQGHIIQNIENEIGDFVVLRADGLFAYQLAVVVDDAFQGIMHVVRGADLLNSTPRQIYLQRLLNLPTPHYMHLPIAVNTQGEKLSKQTLAAPVDANNPVATLLRALAFLQQAPPAELASYDLQTLWQWALANWRAENMVRIRTLPVD